MKKLNSIWYGSKLLGISGLLTVIVPLILYLINCYIAKSVFFPLLIRISMALGLAVFAFFTIMLVIELKQDKRINRQYSKLKYSRINISPGVYECQYCGARSVKAGDEYCKTCGTKFL